MPRGSHYGSDYWVTYSYKLKRQLSLYSMLEFYQFIILEMDPKVELFCEQPLKIKGVFDGKKKNSVFDFWVKYKDESEEFQEVKSSSDLTGDDRSAVRAKEQIAFQKKWCSDHGYNYKVISEDVIFDGQHRIPNLKILHSHLLRLGGVDETIANRLCKKLKSKKLSLEEIFILNYAEKAEMMGIIAYLYYNGMVIIDLNKHPLDKDTEVILCEEENIIL